MMIKKAMLIGAIGFFGAQEAQANFYTGNQLFAWGESLMRVRENRIMGSDISDANMYYGYVSGVYDLGSGVLFCASNQLNLNQISDVVYQYLKQNPKRRAENASDLAVDALSETFPCKE